MGRLRSAYYRIPNRQPDVREKWLSYISPKRNERLSKPQTIGQMSSRLDICRRNLLLRKAMDIGGMMNIAKIMKTISPLLVALIAASASASPVWKIQNPVTPGFSVFPETKKSRIAVDAQGVAIQGYDPV